MFPLVSDQLWVCRMCEHLASAMENGQDNCGRADCGSPIRGKSFPFYKGPLAGNLSKYCFVCGCDAEGEISHLDGGLDAVRVGVCARHCEEIYRLSEKERYDHCN